LKGGGKQARLGWGWVGEKRKIVLAHENQEEKQAELRSVGSGRRSMVS
jgi:hypothetical protein